MPSRSAIECLLTLKHEVERIAEHLGECPDLHVARYIAAMLTAELSERIMELAGPVAGTEGRAQRH